MKRACDVVFALLLLGTFIVPMVLLAILVRMTSPGPALHWSNRVGRDNRIFRMPKFRTMRTDTPQLATHLLSDAGQWLTPIGPFLRSTSLDEMPQLWSVLTGEMSFVGPRPALFNQDDLVRLRTERGVDAIRPGITGWAQINGRDELPIAVKVEYDSDYVRDQTLLFDLKIVALTLVKVLRRDDIAPAKGNSMSASERLPPRKAA